MGHGYLFPSSGEIVHNYFIFSLADFKYVTLIKVQLYISHRGKYSVISEAYHIPETSLIIFINFYELLEQ